MSTCSRLDLQTLGSQPIMPKNLLDHLDIDAKVVIRGQSQEYSSSSSSDHLGSFDVDCC